jgi:hypothetical protein
MIVITFSNDLFSEKLKNNILKSPIRVKQMQQWAYKLMKEVHYMMLYNKVHWEVNK